MAVDELIEQEDRFYIVAGPAPPDARTLVLKHGDTFGIFNVYGDIDRRANSVQGLFTHGMRYLSRLEIRIEGQRMLLLSSKVTDDNARIIVDLTNPDIAVNGHLMLPHGSLHISRSIFLWADSCFERLTLISYNQNTVDLRLGIRFEADFADVFELRGTMRARRGEMLEPQIDRERVALGYRGLDEVERRAIVHGRPQPDAVTESEIEYRIALPPRTRTQFEFSIRCEPGGAIRSIRYGESADLLRDDVKRCRAAFCRISSSNALLNQWMRRSLADVRTLLTETEAGPYPYAGIPWFSTPFGRDGIITALQLLWVNPDIAKGVLAYLAATQATEHDGSRDAEPGKILHERRTDEMAVTGEVPFGQYYGSVDSTPLFIVLAGAYYQATADRMFIESIWSNIQAALRWIDDSGDMDGDGFVEYQSKTRDGLSNQGWKDSYDSIFHSDGALAQPPIALCEVQGYVYDARRRAAALAQMLGHHDMAVELNRRADRLKEQFNEVFWQDDIGLFALALDRDKRPCVVRSSNAGHCLFSGIADHDRAGSICDVLLSNQMHTGWAIRTIGKAEARFNPMSYHNGSTWPHDNALIAAGLARYGCRDAAMRVLDGWLEASGFLDLHRLPELCCGFRRRRGKGPTLYPVACSPQAWAAGAVFMMLASVLGLSIDGVRRQVHVHRPHLPTNVDELSIRRLRVNDGSIDLVFQRNRHRRGDVGVLVTRKQGPIDLIVTK